MSYVNTAKLKGLLDPTLTSFTTTIPFTTSPIIIDALTQYNSYIHSFRIANNDITNVVQYRQGALDQPLKNIPISSQESGPGWESFLQIIPDAVTGSGYIEIELVLRDNAELKA